MLTLEVLQLDPKLHWLPAAGQVAQEIVSYPKLGAEVSETPLVLVPTPREVDVFVLWKAASALNHLKGTSAISSIERMLALAYTPSVSQK